MPSQRLSVGGPGANVEYIDTTGLSAAAIAPSPHNFLAYLRLFDLMTVDDGYHRPIEGAWTLGRVAVREEARGTGLGRALLSEAIEWVKENTEARQLVISAQSYLKDSYYGAAGFVQVGEPYLEVGIEHVEMILKL